MTGQWSIQQAAPDMRPKRVITITAGDYACTALDRRIYVRKTDDEATLIVLPPDPTIVMIITVKDGKGDAATHMITVTGSPTIDGAVSFVMNQNWQSQDFAWNGLEWSAQ